MFTIEISLENFKIEDRTLLACLMLQLSEMLTDHLKS